MDIHLHPDLQFHPTVQSIASLKGADQLTDKINQALQEMRDDGSLSKLAIQFFEEDASKEPDVEMEKLEDIDG